MTQHQFFSLFLMFVLGIIFGTVQRNPAIRLNNIAPQVAPYAELIYGITIAFVFMLTYSILDWYNWRMGLIGGGGLFILFASTPVIKEGFTEQELLATLRKQIRWSLSFIALVALIAWAF